MAQKTLRGVLITPNTPNTYPREYTFNYENYASFYSLLECETFDIVSRKFKDKVLDIYCDDNGLFVPDNKPAIVTCNAQGKIVEQIVGNVFIVACNNKGETISLTDEEVIAVLACIASMVTVKNGKLDAHSVAIAHI
jgi:hypothetical protein